MGLMNGQLGARAREVVRRHPVAAVRMPASISSAQVYGMSHKSIANTVGIAVHTVEQHITRATRQLGESLKRYSPEYPLLYAFRQNVNALFRAQRGSRPRFASDIR